jgi:L-ascorbate metabolism protein UlaG (beta-lactamase superfamily)
LGYLISADNQSIYHAGDTELHDSFGEIKTDIALLPIGGAYTMDVVDAVRATKTMKPKYVIPMHYNTFDEIKADSNEFCQRINKSILKTKPIVMGIGETVEL